MMDRETLIDVEHLERDIGLYLKVIQENLTYVVDAREEIEDLTD